MDRSALENLLQLVHEFRHALFSAANQIETFRRIVKDRNSRNLEGFEEMLSQLDKQLHVLYEGCSRIMKRSLSLGEEKEERSSAEQEKPIKPIEILWVDDDALHLSRFRGLLDDANWKVTLATTVEKTLSLIRRRTFDGVLVDLIMPPGPLSIEETAGGQLTGLALSRLIRHRHSGIPIIFLTVARSDEVLEWCREHPPAKLLFKPQLTVEAVKQLEVLIRDRTDSSVDRLQSLLKRFDVFVEALASRHQDRPPLTIMDEYDVQDLLRAMLVLNYDEVRPEEWIPVYAGGSSRVDFLLPEDRTAIEVKFTRAGLSRRQLADQLLIDTARYRKHPEIRALIFFIVDAAGILKNQKDLIRDLESKLSPDLDIRVVVCQGTLTRAGPSQSNAPAKSKPETRSSGKGKRPSTDP